MDFNIDHVAKLAKLTLTDEERSAMVTQLPSILAYVSKLQEVDTEGVEANAYLTKSTNVFRADEPQPVDAATRRALIDAFPEKLGDALQVPGVFE